jgi:hypothetical protein
LRSSLHPLLATASRSSARYRRTRHDSALRSTASTEPRPLPPARWQRAHPLERLPRLLPASAAPLFPVMCDATREWRSVHACPRSRFSVPLPLLPLPSPASLSGFLSPVSHQDVEHEDCGHDIKFDNTRDLVGFCDPLPRLDRHSIALAAQTPLTWFGLTCQARCYSSRSCEVPAAARDGSSA